MAEMTLTQIIHAHRRDGETMTQCQARLRSEVAPQTDEVAPQTDEVASQTDGVASQTEEVAPIKDYLDDLSKAQLIAKVRANGGKANSGMSKDVILAMLREED